MMEEYRFLSLLLLLGLESVTGIRVLLQNELGVEFASAPNPEPLQVVIDPRAWAPFLPPPPPAQASAEQTPTSLPPASFVQWPKVLIAASPSEETLPPLPFEKPFAFGLPISQAAAAPTLPSPVKAPSLSYDDGIEKINKGVLLTIILVPTLVGSSILFSTFLAWMCHRPPSLRSSPSSSQRFRDDPSSSSGGRGPFAPWLWGRSAPNAPRKELAKALEFPLLESATNNFSTGNLLGEGGSGRVFKARLDEDVFAAVKLLFTDGKHAEQGFQAEVELLSGIRHPNLVSLLGFCSHGEYRLLVYEFMQNGSLHDQLHGPSHGSALTWYLRMKIALDAAKGLEHLHEHCSPLVIHRDLKSSNILLDASFNAKVSDFGLALSAPSGVRRNETVQGTLGYVAPEYMLNGSLTEKSDVYAFGVVLLELMTGRKSIDPSMPTGCESLVSWAMPLLSDRGRLMSIVDASVRDSVNIKHLHQVAAVAMLCVQKEASYRPLIADVVSSLVPLVPMELGGTFRVVEDGDDDDDDDDDDVDVDVDDDDDVDVDVDVDVDDHNVVTRTKSFAAMQLEQSSKSSIPIYYYDDVY